MEKTGCLLRSLMILKNWSLILSKRQPHVYRKTAMIIYLYKLRIACRSTIPDEQKARNKFQRTMSRTGVGRENLLHAQVQASVQFCHRYPPLFPTTTKMMEARHPPEATVAKRYRGRWSTWKPLTTKILVFLVLHWVNWRAQGNNYDYYYMGQGGEDTENPALSFRRHHKYTRSKSVGTRYCTSLSVVVEL